MSPQQLNAYVYAGNNPVTFDDPTGENWLSKHISSAWKATKSYAKKHAASAASFVAGAVVGAVLGAGVTAACGALGFCTFGVGGVVCATVGYALVGAVSGAVSGAVRSIVSQKMAGKKFSWKKVGKAARSDAISGAIGGALGGPLLGKVAGKVAKPLTTRLAAAGSRLGSKLGQSKAGQGLVAAARKVGLTCSFTGDTPVVMADGSVKPIGQVKKGDVVVSRDPATGKVGGKVVEDTYVHDDITITVYVAGGAVRTTEDHPWYNADTGKFVRADKLHPGDHVLTVDGDLAEVTGVDLVPVWAPAYNLTVAGWHTYHVVTDPNRGPPLGGAAVGGQAGAQVPDATSLLVHNCPAPDAVELLEIRLDSARYPESAAHVRDAMGGDSGTVSLSRSGASARRSESLRGQKRIPGLDRDEWPPALFQEGGEGASVRGVTPRDNRGAGASIGNQCRGLPDGTTVQVRIC